MKKLIKHPSVAGGIRGGASGLMGNKKNIFVPLHDVHPYSSKWNVQARVEQKFPIYYFSSKKKLKMLLVDVKVIYCLIF
jgi:hypothetical protein